MPRIDFSGVENTDEYAPIPEGTYTCQIVDVEESRTQAGDEMWNLRLEVTEDEYKGRFLFDRLVFSDSAMKRVKLICSRLGLDVSGTLDLTKEMVLDKMCRVSTDIKEYHDSEGRTKRCNNVLFAGYESLENEEPAGETAAGTPF